MTDIIIYYIELYKNLQNHESDCFRKATLSLVDGCNSVDSNGIENMECKLVAYYISNNKLMKKIDALMLTICELGDAFWTLPGPCLTISQDPATKYNDIRQCIK